MKRFFLIIISAMLLVSCSNNSEIIGSADSKTDILIIDSSISNDKVVKAYLNQDITQLNSDEKTLLYAAEKAISEFYSGTMSDYEICISVHDWIVTHTTYDQSALNVFTHMGEYSDIAFGALTTGEAICSGYADTLKLFLDMLEIDNLLVIGKSHTSAAYEDHRWNMVCIDGEWYHIDCTCDDFIPDYSDRPALHIYTFLSDSEMEYSGHVWDKDTYPTANSNSLNYYIQTGLYAEDASAVIDMVNNAISSGQKYCEVAMSLPFCDIMIENTTAFYTEFSDYFVIIYQIY